MPDYAARLGEQGMIDLDAIAAAYAWLHANPSSGRTFELDLRTARESW